MKKSEVGSPVVTDTWEVIFLRDKENKRCWGRKRIAKSQWRKDAGWSAVSPVFADPTAVGIAWETRWFGEGSERLAKELREVGRDGMTFVGPPMVLKASITVSNSVNVDSKEFHKRFCKSQLKAQSFASRFNEVVSKLPISVATIEFLPCWVYMVRLNSGERKGYLVEPSLDVNRYMKFNDNQGSVYESFSRPSARCNPQKPPFGAGIVGLGTIEEEAEESSEESEEGNGDCTSLRTFVEEAEESGEHSEESNEACTRPEREPAITPSSTLIEEVEASDVLQAFSCWTFKASKRRYLVCDLQGTFEEDVDGVGKYRLTDPVIHTSAVAQEEIRSSFQSNDEALRERFGRTDRGQDGINDFFRTHKCSKLCRMLGSRRLRPEYELHRQPATGFPSRTWSSQQRNAAEIRPRPLSMQTTMREARNGGLAREMRRVMVDEAEL